MIPRQPGAENTLSTEWYVVHCQPFKERYAAAALEEQLEVTVYLPEVRRYFRGQAQSAPLFPRYLFVKADLRPAPPSRINATPGVSRLVSFDEQPLPVPAVVIRALHRRVEQLNAHGGLPEHSFEPGDTVQIKAGPLIGLEAVFVGPTTPSERVRILLEFMGRLNEIQVHRRVLEPANVSHPLKGQRLTRGKGRRIRQGDGVTR